MIVVFIMLLTGVIVFILIGVKVFAVGGSFSTTINSLLPAGGGGYINKAEENKNSLGDKLNPDKINSYVNEIIDVDQI